MTPGYNRIPREEGIIPGKILATVNMTRKTAQWRKEAENGEPILGAQCSLRCPDRLLFLLTTSQREEHPIKCLRKGTLARMELESRLIHSCGCRIEETESELSPPGRKCGDKYRYMGKVDQKA